MPTKTEIEARRTALYDIVAEQYPRMQPGSSPYGQKIASVI